MDITKAYLNIFPRLKKLKGEAQGGGPLQAIVWEDIKLQKQEKPY